MSEKRLGRASSRQAYDGWRVDVWEGDVFRGSYWFGARPTSKDKAHAVRQALGPGAEIVR